MSINQNELEAVNSESDTVPNSGFPERWKQVLEWMGARRVDEETYQLSGSPNTDIWWCDSCKYGSIGNYCRRCGKKR